MDTARCRDCDAILPVDASWCSLCFAPVGVLAGALVPAPTPADRPPLTEQGEEIDPSAQSPTHEIGPRLPTWPCMTCGASNPLADVACNACGAPFLAAASEPPVVAVPVFGDLLARSRGQQLTILSAVAVGAVAVVIGVLALLHALI